MLVETLTALLVFAFVSSITPGPNNLMLMTSGANFGFQLTIPHLLGVGLGFTAMIVLVGLGVMQIFTLFPSTYNVLKVLSIAYLLYLAFKIAFAQHSSQNQSKRNTPMTFIQAVLFQWVNPKAWTMALTSISVYAPNQNLSSVLIVAAVFGLVNFPCITTWVLIGQKISRLLVNKTVFRTFNVVMASLLVVSVLPAMSIS